MHLPPLNIQRGSKVRASVVERYAERKLTGDHEPRVRGTFHGVAGDAVHGPATITGLGVGGGHREHEEFPSRQHVMSVI